MLKHLHDDMNSSRVCTGFQFAFVNKPHLTFDINMKGVLFSEVPGLVGELKKRLISVIASEACEPARVWVNLNLPFYNLVTRKQTGKRGQVKVCAESMQHVTCPTIHCSACTRAIAERVTMSYLCSTTSCMHL